MARLKRVPGLVGGLLVNLATVNSVGHDLHPAFKRCNLVIEKRYVR